MVIAVETPQLIHTYNGLLSSQIYSFIWKQRKKIYDLMRKMVDITEKNYVFLWFLIWNLPNLKWSGSDMKWTMHVFANTGILYIVFVFLYVKISQVSYTITVVFDLL